MKQYLLIDIGGTYIKYSLADEQARKISGGKVPTPLTNIDDLLAVIEGFAAPLQGQFVGCAISMPGRIDTRNGIAHTGGMLSAFMWEQPFAAQVEARLGVPVTIANDGKCAAAAEGWTGALAGGESWELPGASEEAYGAIWSNWPVTLRQGENVFCITGGGSFCRMRLELLDAAGVYCA